MRYWNNGKGSWGFTVSGTEIIWFLIRLIGFVITSIVFNLSFWWLCVGWALYVVLKKRDETRDKDDTRGQ